MTETNDETNGFWNSRPAITILVVAILAVTVGLTSLGVVMAFLIVTVAAILARKQHSARDLGFRSPGSWPRLLATTIVYGFLIQFIMLAIVEPLAARWTGAGVDLSAFDGVRGNAVNALILLAIGWVVGGFLEEMTFRGFVTGRVRWLLGSGNVATWTGVLVAAVAFGLAHAYQGTTGMISTGLTGLLFGAIYVLHRFNLWYAIFTHGFTNTVGILAIYLDLDWQLARWRLG